MKTEQIEKYNNLISEQNEIFKQWQALSLKLMHAEVYTFPDLVASLSNLFMQLSSRMEAIE